MQKFWIIFIMIFVCTLAFGRNPFQEASIKHEDKEPSVKTIVIPLNYNDATTVAKLLTEKNSRFLSPEGHISVDKNTNSLWVQDYSAKLKQLQQLIAKIDNQAQQVQIEARIINVDTDFTQELGVEFGTKKTDAGATTGGLNMDIPIQSISMGHFNFVIAKLNSNTMLDMEITALESEGHAEVISRPKLITINRKTAHISAGEDIPYQEKTGEGNTSVTFKKAVLGLKVTPNIVSKNKLLLNIVVNQDKASAIMVNGEPTIQTREIQTQVLVNNNQTVVLGGIYEQGKKDKVVRIPFLGSIPIIGFLFRNKQIETERKELLIFITPKIIH